jgi:GT2 family glycosyltransferase
LQGDLVAFFDDDVVLSPNYLCQLVDAFTSNPRLVGAGGAIVNDVPRSAPARAFRAVFDLGNDDGRLRRSGDVVYLQNPTAAQPVDVLSGSNMLFRRDRIGGLRFDETLQGYAYMEDVDFCLEVGKRGELWIIPTATLVHNKTSTARVPTRDYVTQVFANSTYLFRKHRSYYNLSWLHFGRRLTGRALAYLVMSITRRSIDPAVGIIKGVASILSPRVTLDSSR